MPTIRLRLEPEEIAPLRRLAHELQVDPDDVAYAALNHFMGALNQPEVKESVARLKAARRTQLPLWADHAREIHAYESMT
jgi:hypothetical protein